MRDGRPASIIIAPVNSRRDLLNISDTRFCPGFLTGESSKVIPCSDKYWLNSSEVYSPPWSYLRSFMCFS